jgi:hypothetical protein
MESKSNWSKGELQRGRDASEHQPLVRTIQFAAEQVGWLGGLGI